MYNSSTDVGIGKFDKLQVTKHKQQKQLWKSHFPKIYLWNDFPGRILTATDIKERVISSIATHTLYHLM